MSETASFLSGATAMGFVVAGVFFWRFWRETADRLFAMFASAMWLLAASSLIVVLVHPAGESRHYLYLIRLVGFGLIIAAIVDKNRSDGSPRTP
jgi:hypothetical protein